MGRAEDTEIKVPYESFFFFFFRSIFHNFLPPKEEDGNNLFLRHYRGEKSLSWWGALG